MTPTLLLWLAACGGDPAPVEHTVVRGDTLSKLAQRYGTTVPDLKARNGLSGDVIHVGQVLVVVGPGRAAAPDPPSLPKAARKVAPRAPEGGRSDDLPPRPRPEPCLAAPMDAGAAGMAASAGLAPGAARAAVDAVLPHTAGCLDGEMPAGTLLVELVVGCDGVVDRARIADDPGWPGAVSACVVEVLRRADFPAHALPDGETVLQPITYAR